MADPQLPFFVEWGCNTEEHPSAGAGPVSVDRIEIAGDPDTISAWLGEPKDHPLDDIEIDWVDAEEPGIVAVWFQTPQGSIRID
jgi:hypothetical protein